MNSSARVWSVTRFEQFRGPNTSQYKQCRISNVGGSVQTFCGGPYRVKYDNRVALSITVHVTPYMFIQLCLNINIHILLSTTHIHARKYSVR